MSKINKQYDFVIIGSGPAGSILAWNLAKSNLKVAIIDRATNIKIFNDKNSFIFTPYINNSPNYYTPLFSNQLGGNSALWNNKISLITKEEFVSGKWPFNYEELLAYSKNLAKQLDLDHQKISFVDDFKNIKFSRSTRAKKLGNLYFSLKISDHKNIDIYHSSSPVYINSNEDCVKKINIKNIKGEISELKINKALIFCAGGLGNPHILKNLLKDHNTLIGKKLSDHPHINIGNLSKNDISEFINFSKYFINNSEQMDEDSLFLSLKNYFVGLQVDFSQDPSRILKRLFIKSRSFLSKKLLSLLINYYSLFLKFLSLLKIRGKYSFELFFSQNQNLNNLMELDPNSKDEFDLVKSNIIWDFTRDELDIYNHLINQLIGKEGLLLKTNNFFKFQKNKIMAGLHPSCTTQIDNENNLGCVDKNLKLKGYDNIFINGSSVFPNNGFTNPTWTIMTLSNRLSKHLEDL